MHTELKSQRHDRVAHLLTGKVALVVGGDRLTDEVVDMLLAAGAEVVVASPCAERRQGLSAAERPRLHVWSLCLATDHGAQRARRRVERTFGRLDLVIAGLGSWPPPERDLEQVRLRWRRDLGDASVIDPDLDAHYALARTLMPLMAKQAGAQYLLVNDTTTGAAASATGRLLLKDAVAAEARAIGVGVHTAVLMAGAPVSGGEVAVLAIGLMVRSTSYSRTFRLGAMPRGLPVAPSARVHRHAALPAVA